MSASLPPKIDCIRLARNGSEMSGSLPLSGLSRLQDASIEALGEAIVSLSFYRDAQRRHVITGSVEADITVACQRCLQGMNVHIAGDVSLGIVTSDAQVTALPSEYEPLLVIEDEFTDLHSVVEDELLLALPLAPLHPDNEVCLGRDDIRRVEQKNTAGNGAQADLEEEKPNPFAALASLKKH